MRPAILALLSLLLAAPAAQAAIGQQAELALADGVPGDVFAAVAISGNTLVVGAPGRKVGDNAGQGALFVYEKPADGWAHAVPVARLTVSDGAAGDSLGESVAISGDTVVAGAGARRVGTHDFQGAAYVFEKPAGGWHDETQTAALTAPDGATSDGFGASVGVSGDTIAVGPGQHSVGENFRQGEAYGYRKPATGWTTTSDGTRLIATDGAADDGLGRAVAVSGDRIVVGAAGHKVGTNSGQGAVYLFDRPPAGAFSEGQFAEVTATDGAAHDGLGSAVAIDGDTVVAGAPSHQVGLSHQGAAYVFVAPFNLSATQTAELTASDGVTNDLFGGAVGVSGDKVVASSFRHQVGPNQQQGATYLYQRHGFIWSNATETAETTAPDGVTNDLFGITLAISGNVAVGGGGLHPIDQGIGKGAVYLFGPGPEIAIASPASGATFAQGQSVAAAYSCTAPDGATVSSCAGTVPDGAPLDTSTVGPHSFSVNALDSDGFTATQDASYTVVPAPKPPKISGLKQAARVWRERKRGHAHKHRIGTTFSLSVDQDAQLALRFTRHRGRGSSAAGTLRAAGHAGVNRIKFAGRLSRTKRLTPGRYTLRVTATNAAGLKARSRRLGFRIVAR